VALQLVCEKLKYTKNACIQKKKMSTEVLSIRIKKDLKREAERLNLNIKDIVEKALTEAIEQAKGKDWRKQLMLFCLK